MKIVIDIPEELYRDVVKNRFIYDEDGEVITHAIINSTPLPEHHGRIIDESQIKHIECHTEQELYGAKIRYVKTTDAPTIIEAEEGSDSE